MLADVGVKVESIRLDEGEAVPAVGDVGGVVVLGGPMGVHDDPAHPWLAAERDLIGAAVAGGLPVLGICLGAQQVAAALGGRVTAGASDEVGVGDVELTAEGRRDPVFGPEYNGLSGTSVPCVHWHRDTFSLPDGAVHLAATRRFPNQAFRVGTNVYGLQFHVEVDGPLAEGWRPLLPGGARLPAAAVVRVETVGRRILRRFVDVALDAARGRG
ncbi:MAG: type 1 glutamine amidotransferase [Acidimicrobiales bacterium]